MTCKCGHEMIMDREFAYQAMTYNNPTKRYVCVVGHSTYDPSPIKPEVKARCAAHKCPLPCAVCAESARRMRRMRAGQKGGNAWKGKRSGNAFAPEQWTCTR